MTEIVYSGHDNKASIVVSQDGVPMDFAAVTRMTLALRGLGVVADTDIDSDLIVWSVGGGAIEFDLGGIDVAAGLYQATLVAYDPLHTNGQVLADPAAPQEQRLVVRVA